MFKMEMDGLKDLEKNLDNLARKAESLDGEHNVSFEQLFTPEFMQRNTSFQTIQQLFEESGFEVNSSEDFEMIPDQEWNEFIQKTTRFADWEEMLQEASSQWVARQLGF